MYVTTIYNKLDTNQKRKVLKFLKDNFDNQTEFSLEDNTVIILYIIDKEIYGCVCLLNNKYLIKKLIKNNVPLKYYSIVENFNSYFIYNLCIHKYHRNEKIGTKLINYMIERMQQINVEYLHTHATNTISKGIFLKYKFIEDSNYTSVTNEQVYSLFKYI